MRSLSRKISISVWPLNAIYRASFQTTQISTTVFEISVPTTRDFQNFRVDRANEKRPTAQTHLNDKRVDD